MCWTAWTLLFEPTFLFFFFPSTNWLKYGNTWVTSVSCFPGFCFSDILLLVLFLDFTRENCICFLKHKPTWRPESFSWEKSKPFWSSERRENAEVTCPEPRFIPINITNIHLFIRAYSGTIYQDIKFMLLSVTDGLHLSSLNCYISGALCYLSISSACIRVKCATS